MRCIVFRLRLQIASLDCFDAVSTPFLRRSRLVFALSSHHLCLRIIFPLARLPAGNICCATSAMQHLLCHICRATPVVPHDVLFAHATKQKHRLGRV
jgi:hypothetical protein